MNACPIEICVETFEAALAAERGGASRIELCARLDLNGLTPEEDLTAAVVRVLSIPVRVLIRPHDRGFVYTPDEFREMRQQVQRVKEAGAAGVVLGVLLADGRVDVGRSRELVELARPMKVTFHRAFDKTPDLTEALEAVIATGADCLLTSGGAAEVLSGAEAIARLRSQAGTRIQPMAGGGLRLPNLVEVLRRTGVNWLHGSLSRREGAGASAADKAERLEADVREAVRLMQGELRRRCQTRMT
jgi:copper homeostasis protein